MVEWFCNMMLLFKVLCEWVVTLSIAWTEWNFRSSMISTRKRKHTDIIFLMNELYRMEWLLSKLRFLNDKMIYVSMKLYRLLNFFEIIKQSNLNNHWKLEVLNVRPALIWDSSAASLRDVITRSPTQDVWSHPGSIGVQDPLQSTMLLIKTN